MGVPEIVFGSVLVLVLLGVAGYFGRRQFQSLTLLRADTTLPDDERARLVRQAWRRLVGCGLMTVLAVLLVVALVFLEDPAHRLAAFADEAGPNPQFNEEQNHLRRIFGWFWLVFLLLLLSLVILAGLDLWATRRHGLRERRRLLADRREMVAREAARLRHGRNGHV